MSYDFDEHRFRFAVWTSARAVQRGLRNATTPNILKLFYDDVIKKEIKNLKHIKNFQDYDRIQKNICLQLIKVAKELEIQLSYGQASKLLAIFVKTYYILPEKGKGNISKYAHPPIDSIVLNNLKKKKIIMYNLAWSKLDKNSYYKLIDNIRKDEKIKLEMFWMLEEYWNIS